MTSSRHRARTFRSSVSSISAASTSHLSHYCPTSTSLLFEHSGPIEIVEGHPPIPELDMLEGLDAREALPPLRPGTREQLMSFDELSGWERDQVAAREDRRTARR